MSVGIALDPYPCPFCGEQGVNLRIQELDGDPDHFEYCHDTCLALYCEYNHIKPPESFVKYCIDKLGLRPEAKGRK